jgi:ribosomal protein L7Ae-like RNA K-turn-binding protein
MGINKSSRKIETDNISVVYMTKDISPAGLISIYDALRRKAMGKVAVKISTGELGGHHFLSPDLIKGLIQLN